MPDANNHVDSDKPLSIVIVGASGDLARKKIIPALFYLYCQKYLPANFKVFGFARSPLTRDQFREKVREFLTCRYVPGESCAERMDEFLSQCCYMPGQYQAADSFLDLYRLMQEHEEDQRKVNRLYYLAIPPSVFLDVAHALGDAGLVMCGPEWGWSRVVIEKPFGRDRQTSDAMAEGMARVFTEDQIYRIDHYLGKEIVQNLMVLRFANPVFGPLWSREYIESIQIVWKEDVGIGDRGGYFDGFGIIRDVMQNHLLQILSLVTMEKPAGYTPQAIRDEKVRVLQAMPPVTLDDLVVGQYRGRQGKTGYFPSYNEEPGVPPDSMTPTYAAAALRINNPRWEGVPILIRAGKALDAQLNEITIQFKAASRNIFTDFFPELPKNQLVIRVQPDEAIYLKVINKAPGLKLSLVETELDLKYKSAFHDVKIPEAYEFLLLDALRGDKSLFIRSDELAAAWDIFTPALHELEQKRIQPDPYDFGSRGPESAARLAARYGIPIK